MLRPAYTIFAEMISQDRLTNRISFFALLEKFVIAPAKPGEPADEGEEGVPVFKLRGTLVSAWIKEPEDNDCRYDFEVFVYADEDHDNSIVLGGGVAELPDQPDKRLHRIIATIPMFPPVKTESGLLWIATRVRPSGSDTEWVSQAYPIDMEIDPAAIRSSEDQPSEPPSAE